MTIVAIVGTIEDLPVLYSAGECPVCSSAGDALFVKDAASGRLFFFCPHCGCAWRDPPRPHEVETIEPPERFAPHGMSIPTRAEIVAQGREHLIARHVNNDEWMGRLRDFLGDGHPVGPTATSFPSSSARDVAGGGHEAER